MIRLLLTSAVFLAVAGTSLAEQYANIPPDLKCRFARKNWSFCKGFPNLARKWDVCDPAHLGHIEWCREDIVVTDRDPHGNFETYDAVVVTYRPVYENGAWGEKFKRTYRKEATLVVPPVIYK